MKTDVIKIIKKDFYDTPKDGGFIAQLAWKFMKDGRNHYDYQAVESDFIISHRGEEITDNLNNLEKISFDDTHMNFMYSIYLSYDHLPDKDELFEEAKTFVAKIKMFILDEVIKDAV